MSILGYMLITLGVIGYIIIATIKIHSILLGEKQISSNENRESSRKMQEE